MVDGKGAKRDCRTGSAWLELLCVAVA